VAKKATKKKAVRKKRAPVRKKRSDKSTPRRRIPGEKRRVNFKIDEELAEWAFGFAENHKTSVTQLITDFFVTLRKQEEAHLGQDAEQI